MVRTVAAMATTVNVGGTALDAKSTAKVFKFVRAQSPENDVWGCGRWWVVADWVGLATDSGGGGGGGGDVM